jgi:hypothetical protein
VPCIQQLTQEKRNRARRDCTGGEGIGGRGGRFFVVVNNHSARPEMAEQNTMSRREAHPNFEYIGISMECLASILFHFAVPPIRLSRTG